MRTEVIKGMYKVGDVYYRKRKKFLFFPKTIDNEKRWLEVAEWEEYWHNNTSWEYMRWIPTKWIDPTPEFIK